MDELIKDLLFAFGVVGLIRFLWKLTDGYLPRTRNYHVSQLQQVSFKFTAEIRA